MKHLTPDEMVLHYYGEGDCPAEEHLACCEECRTEYRALQRVLNAADGFTPPERDAGFEERLWRRLSRDLPRRAQRRWWLQWKPLAACAALAVMLFFAGRWSAQPELSAPDAADGVLLQAVEYHLDRSQYLLQEVTNDPGHDASREEVKDLLGANRLYRQTAEMSGESAVADLLGEVERVLMEMENQEPDAAQLRGLLLKLRVAGQELRRREYPDFKEDRL